MASDKLGAEYGARNGAKHGALNEYLSWGLVIEMGSVHRAGRNTVHGYGHDGWTSNSAWG